jgi:hypothetical protein
LGLLLYTLGLVWAEGRACHRPIDYLCVLLL